MGPKQKESRPSAGQSPAAAESPSVVASTVSSSPNNGASKRAQHQGGTPMTPGCAGMVVERDTPTVRRLDRYFDAVEEGALEEGALEEDTLEDALLEEQKARSSCTSNTDSHTIVDNQLQFQGPGQDQPFSRPDQSPPVVDHSITPEVRSPKAQRASNSEENYPGGPVTNLGSNSNHFLGSEKCNILNKLFVFIFFPLVIIYTLSQQDAAEEGIKDVSGAIKSTPITLEMSYFSVFATFFFNALWVFKNKNALIEGNARLNDLGYANGWKCIIYLVCAFIAFASGAPAAAAAASDSHAVVPTRHRLLSFLYGYSDITTTNAYIKMNGFAVGSIMNFSPVLGLSIRFLEVYSNGCKCCDRTSIKFSNAFIFILASLMGSCYALMVDSKDTGWINIVQSVVSLIINGATYREIGQKAVDIYKELCSWQFAACVLAVLPAAANIYRVMGDMLGDNVNMFFTPIQDVPGSQALQPIAALGRCLGQALALYCFRETLESIGFNCFNTGGAGGPSGKGSPSEEAHVHASSVSAFRDRSSPRKGGVLDFLNSQSSQPLLQDVPDYGGAPREKTDGPLNIV